MGNTDNVRRVRPDTEVEVPAPQDQEPISIGDAFVIETDETTWIKVGDTWVDTSRIITVGPLSNIYDVDEPPTDPQTGEQGFPEGGVAVQLDSPHDSSQFVTDPTVTVEEVMTLIIEATSDLEEGNN